MVTGCKELTHWERSWCCERLRPEGEESDRGSDSWMVSLTQWTWVWANSRKWGRTGKPGMLLSMGLQRVGHDLVTEQQQKYLQWQKLKKKIQWMFITAKWVGQKEWISEFEGETVEITQTEKQRLFLLGLSTFKKCTEPQKTMRLLLKM